jgi:hypothetical protein
VPRDGYQGWSRAKEDAWLRVFAEEHERAKPKLAAALESWAKEPADPKTVMATLHAKKCYPPCDDCKCVKP